MKYVGLTARGCIGVKYYFLTTYECNTTFLHVRMESAILLFDHVRVQYYFLARECGEEGVLYEDLFSCGY